MNEIEKTDGWIPVKSFWMTPIQRRDLVLSAYPYIRSLELIAVLLVWICVIAIMFADMAW
jgi:hypothetical protein